MKKRSPIYRATYVDRNGKTCTSKIWSIRYSSGKKQVRMSTGTTDLKEAQAFYHREMARLAMGGESPTNQRAVTIGQLLDLVVDDYRLQGHKTVYECIQQVENILKPRIGKLKAAKFGTKEIKAYIAARLADPLWSSEKTKVWKSKREKMVAPATVNRELARIRRAFTLGYENDPPLVERVPKFPMLKEDNIREGILAHDGYLCLRSNLAPHARLALVIAYHTGARRGEILEIDRKHVDLKAGRIMMPGRTTKTGKPKYIPIYGDMRGEIEAAMLMAVNSCPLLVQRDGERVEESKTNGRQLVGPVGFKKRYSTICGARRSPT